MCAMERNRLSLPEAARGRPLAVRNIRSRFLILETLGVCFVVRNSNDFLVRGDLCEPLDLFSRLIFEQRDFVRCPPRFRLIWLVLRSVNLGNVTAQHGHNMGRERNALNRFLRNVALLLFFVRVSPQITRNGDVV